MFLKSGQMTREWYIFLQSVDTLLRELRAETSQAIDDIDDLTP